ncbi:MAG TPA: helix-turn-helix domain-containing protein [Cyclobacteriaceae bacterium]|nr:helix-turn-helix domain-containing protein [Cyclobacteriaceae bacterium]HMV10228.1 helix-turn-helix domain-containing protein [Cyclobacteriaceae bacterium]HMV89762.1 helix-turn-helix domain-containing protein [Cyclobacteriaceae bacterium]HMX01565.1 helix-turn-helix domain-containing protein [Cyclobacteriaceae bacterium]HMX51434.1 helix-turn-helix domain-containing protein [Cyclobacteriaceae bacterium]
MNTVSTTFDFWILLFAGFSFIGLFYSVKLLASKGESRMDVLLGLYLLMQSVTVLEYVLFWTKLIYSVHGFADISLLFGVLYGPILLIYFNQSFGNKKSLKKYSWHFMPFIILLTLKVPFYFSSPEAKFYHTHDILFGSLFDYYPWVKIWHMTLYCVVLFMLINNQSGVGSMRRWARWIVGFFSFYVLLSLGYQGLVQSGLLTPDLDYVVSLATCGTIFFVAWYGRGFAGVADGLSLPDSLKAAGQTPSSFRNELIIESTPKHVTEKYKNSGLPKNLEIKLSEQLEILMQEQKLYKLNDLKLETLAEKLNTNKHFISQVINEVHKVNFFEYINLKRIEEAKQLLRLKPKKDLNVIEVAYEVGFNNKGTFNSVFKRITGLTPTEFRRQSQQLLEPRSN